MVQQLENRVLEAQLGRRAGRQIGVDALRVGIEHGPIARIRRRVLGLGDALPAHRPEEGVRFDLRVAEHLGEAARADVAPEVHLPEALLGVDVALGQEQVVLVVGVDVSHTHVVPYDLRGCLQTGDRDLTVDVGEGPVNGEPHGQRDSDGREQDDTGDDAERDLPPFLRSFRPVARRSSVGHGCGSYSSQRMLRRRTIGA